MVVIGTTNMTTIKELKEMKSEPASKEWFEKHGLPKSIKHHPLKKKLAGKMKNPQGYPWGLKVNKISKKDYDKMREKK